MANTRKNMMDALCVQLKTMSSIDHAVLELLTPSEQRAKNKYVGVIVGDEETVVEDSTHIRYRVDVWLKPIVRGKEIETCIKDIKNLISGTSNTIATDIGALQVSLVGMTNPVNVTSSDQYSSAFLALDVLYVAAKAGF